jgi:hypothetical protein
VSGSLAGATLKPMGLRDAIRGWGSTPDERATPLPCDELVPGGVVLVRAVDVAAPAEVVFRWLCQLRVAPYSYDLIDNLGRRSPQELTPGLERLEAGQRFVALFRLVEFEQGRRVTIQQRSGLLGQVAVSYQANPVSERSCRLVMRLAWGPPRVPLARQVLAVGDLVMARRQLLNLKRLAELQAA